MELQHTLTTPTNLPVFLGTAGDHEFLKSAAETHEQSSDLRQLAALHSETEQSTGGWFADSQRVAKQAFPEDAFSTPRSENDYARASNDQLLAAAKSSDDRAFEELSGRHVRWIRKRVYSILRNLEDTEDVVQDSLLKAYRHLPEFRESHGFSTWITKIAVNTALMLLRKRKSRPEVSFALGGEADKTSRIWDVPDPYQSIERKYAREETLEFMSRAVNRLPAPYRNVLEQYHAQEKSMTEAADKLGITVASAKTRLFRARRRLRSMLEGQRISILDALY
jgi:RNA polymerase sigma-70 factor (ECF subfamily)